MAACERWIELEVVVDLRSDVEVSSVGPGPLAAHEAVRIEHRSLYPDSGGAELATVAVTDCELDALRRRIGSAGPS